MFGNTNKKLEEAFNEKQTVSNPVKAVIMWPHFDAMMSIFEDLYEEWMNEEDKLEFVSELIKESGLSFSKLHSDIEIGLNNGYTIEQQVKIAKMILAS